MGDEVDPRFGRVCGEINLDAFEVLQIDEAPVTVIGGKIKMCQKVCAENGLLDVGNGKRKWEYLVAQGNSMSGRPVAGDGCAIGGG